MKNSINKYLWSLSLISLSVLNFTSPTQAAEKCVGPIVVAVIDTGIDSKHELLRDHLWHDPEKKLVYGWDFSKFHFVPPYEVDKDPNFNPDGTSNPTDSHGHGTHIAGIIASKTQCAQLMSVKYYSDSNSGAQNLLSGIKAINYAIDHHVKIINYSGGGPEFNENEFLAFTRAREEGILVVAAAGNERSNTDLPTNYYYPAAYHLDNIITVASVDENNNLLESSNYGKKKVDIAAIGQDVKSSLPKNKYGTMTGTSQATAQVSGEAAAIWSKYPGLTYQQVKRIILITANKYPNLTKKLRIGGVVNQDKAVKLAIRMAKKSAARSIGSTK